MTPPPGPGALRVAVPAELTRLSPRTGHGRVWTTVLAGLAERVQLVPVELRPFPHVVPAGVRADVWLANGHDRAVLVDEPVVAIVHEVSWMTPEERAPIAPVFGALLAAGTASSVAHAARVITPSTWSRSRVIEDYGAAAERVHHVPYGVGLDVFRPGVPGGPERVRSVLGRENCPYVLFVSSVFPRKNPGVLRRAVARLARQGMPHVLVLLAADAPDRGDSAVLRQAAEAELAAAPGRVVSMPAVSDRGLAALLGGAAAVCLPSLAEGFGLTALEAMACGAPLIASDRGALPEVVGDGGLIAAPTADAVEAALLRVLGDADLAAALRRRARARAETFPWRRTVDGWLGVLERAAAG